MNFERKSEPNTFGKIVGFIVAYFIFVSILFFVLLFMGRLPEGWGYFHIMLLGVTIAGVGTLLKGVLR